MKVKKTPHEEVTRTPVPKTVGVQVSCVMKFLIAEGNCCKEVSKMTSGSYQPTPQKSAIAKPCGISTPNVKGKSTIAKSSASRIPKVRGTKPGSKRAPYKCSHCHRPKKGHTCPELITRIAASLTLLHMASAQEEEVVESIFYWWEPGIFIFAMVLWGIGLGHNILVSQTLPLRFRLPKLNRLCFLALPFLGINPGTLSYGLFSSLLFSFCCTSCIACWNAFNLGYKKPFMTFDPLCLLRRKLRRKLRRQQAKYYQPQAGFADNDNESSFNLVLKILTNMYRNSSIVATYHYARTMTRLRVHHVRRHVESLVSLGVGLSHAADYYGACAVVFLYLQTLHQGDMTSVCSQAVQEGMAFIGAWDDQGEIRYGPQAEIDLSGILRGRATYKTIRESVAYDKLMDLVSVVCAVGLCNFSSVNFSVGGVKLFSNAVKKKHEDTDIFSIVEVIMDTAIFFIEGGYLYFTSGDSSYMQFGDHDAVSLQKRLHEVETAVDAMLTGSLANLITPRTESEVEVLIETLIVDIEKVMRSIKHPGALAAWERKLKTILEHRTAFQQRRADGGLRVAAFGVIISGKTSVGKSTIMQMLHHVLCKTNGFDDDVKKIWKVPATDKYDTNLRNDTVSVFHDDIANTKPDYIERPDTEVMLRTINNVKIAGVMADIDQKGKVHAEPKLYIGSTNVEGLDANVYSNCAISIMRRAIHVQAVIRSEYATDGKLDPDKIEKLLSDVPFTERQIWDFFVKVAVESDQLGNPVMFRYYTKEWKVDPEDGQRKPFFRLQDVDEEAPVVPIFGDPSSNYSRDVRPKLTTADFFRLMQILSQKHFAHQAEVVSIANTLSTKIDVLECGCINKCVCHGRPAELLPDRSRRSCVTNTRLNDEWEKRRDAINSVPDPWEQQAGTTPVAAPPSDVVETLDEITRIQTSFIWWMDRFRGGFEDKLLEAKMTAYLSCCDVLYWPLVFGWKMFCAFQSLWILWMWFRGISFGGFFLFLLGWCAVVALAGILMIWTRFRYEYRLRYVTRAANFVRATLSMEKRYAISCLVGIGTVVTLLYTCLRQRKELCAQGGVTSHDIALTDAKKPTIDAVKAEQWEKLRMSLPAPEDVKTRTALQTIAQTSKNTVFIEATRDDGTTFTMNAFEVQSGILMISHHIFKGERIRARAYKNGAVPGTSYEVILENPQRLGLTDLCLVLAPHMGDVKDMSHYLPPSMFYGECAVVLRKHKNGNVDSDKIRLVPTVAKVDKVIPYDAYQYTSVKPTSVGDCMAPIVAMDVRGNHFIVGFHSAGRGGTHEAIACVVTKPLFDEALAELSKSRLYVKLAESGVEPQSMFGINFKTNEELHPKSPILTLDEESTFGYMGTITGGATYRSNIHKTIISDTVKRVCGVECKFGQPRFKTEVGAETFWAASLKYMAKPASPVPAIDLEYACNDYYRTIGDVLEVSPDLCRELTPLSDVQVVSGIDNKRFIESMNLSTSMGFPLGGPKRPHIVELEPTPDQACPKVFNNSIMQEYYSHEAKWRRGERTYEPFKAVPKDEATPLDKEKVRLFQSANIVLQLGLRKYFLPICRVLSLCPQVSECAVGLNPMSDEWDTMMKHISKFGSDRIVAGDFSKYDLRMSSQLNIASFRLYIDIARDFGTYSKDDLAIMESLATEVCYPVIALNGDMVKLVGSTPSGHNLTVYTNGTNNSLLKRCAFRSILDLKQHDERRFCDEVAMQTYGDDDQGSVSDRIPEFNHTSISKYLGEHGYVYTMPDKTSDSRPYMRAEECDFLKRKSVYHPELDVKLGALSEDSIFKSLHCVGKSELTPETQAVTNIDGAMREWFLHGRDVYEKRRAQMREVAVEHGLVAWCNELSLDFDSAVERWKQRYRPTESPGMT